MILVSARSDLTEGRRRDLPTAVLSICVGVGAIVFAIAIALTAL